MAEAPQVPQLSDILGSFGPVETLAVSRIQAATARAMTRNWTSIPQVTHMDAIDVTALEATRARYRADGLKLTPTPFFMRAVASTLERLPQFNRAFDAETNKIVQRHYIHLGLAVDTPGGLLVAVIRDCNAKAAHEISAESAAIAEKARTKGLTLTEMSGSCLTVSALGPLGGTGFTPIVSANEAAILGISRLTEIPRKMPDESIGWRSTIPVSLTYDHRVINGADAGRFMQVLQEEIRALAETPDAASCIAPLAHRDSTDPVFKNKKED